MENNSFSTIFIYLSPFIAAILVSIVNYYLNIKAKKNELSLQIKIPKIQKIQDKLVELKKYCNQRISFLESSEISPYTHEENTKALCYRTELQDVIDNYGNQLNDKTTLSLKDIDTHLGFLCSSEFAFVAKNDKINVITGYLELCRKIINLIDESMKCLNKEII